MPTVTARSREFADEQQSNLMVICGKDNDQERIPVCMEELSNKSDVFKIMFQDISAEDNEVDFTNVSPEVFKMFLRLFNDNQFEMDFSVINQVIRLAKEFNVGDYLKLCNKLIVKDFTTAQSIIDAFELTIKYNFSFNALNKLVETCILDPKEYLFTLDGDTLKRILQLSAIKIDARLLFAAFFDWVMDQRKLYRENMDLSAIRRICYQSIEFGAMSSSDIRKCVEMDKYGLVFNAKAIRELVISIISARRSAPFNTNIVTEYNIGMIIMFKRCVENNSMEELRFSPVRPMVLYGIKIAAIFSTAANAGTKNATAVVAVVKLVSGQRNINMWKQSFNIEISPIASDESAIVKKRKKQDFKFKEAVVLDPEYEYSIQIAFSSCHEKLTHFICKIEDANDFLPGTNAKMITDLYYSID